ncbi:MAG: ATP-dependent Clp protease adaptor ClpS [Cytophagales bacterium]|nr:ATP-dependent Clp protease adaptor ClpS [Cytophagales bacterium]
MPYVEKTKPLWESDLDQDPSHQIIVYNDEVNTFAYVIETLIEVCGHKPLQAEQCTLIIHHKGKCSVKVGNFNELAPMCTAICERGISAELVINPDYYH